MSQIRHNNQLGLSIIELLIALAISSLLILGITQIYVDNKSNFFFQQGQSDNTENARYTMLIFEEELRRVGYRTTPGSEFDSAFKQVAAGNCSFDAGETINFNAVNNRICLRYKPYIPGLTSCDGIAPPDIDTPYQPAEEVADIIVDLTFTGNSLLCNDQPVFDNLVDLQIEFGVSNAFSRETDQYVNAPSPGQNIQSVRYAALIRSRNNNLATDTQSQAYEYWYETYYGTLGTSAPDRALYLATENTINLRNLTR
tara:strand:- start:5599 stop:6366 length:768 start_codon:yes stop_codon:yes gene_type:complete